MSSEIVFDVKADTRAAAADIIKLLTPLVEIDKAARLTSVSLNLMTEALDAVATHTGMYEWAQTAKTMVTDLTDTLQSVPKQLVSTTKTFTEVSKMWGGFSKDFKNLKSEGQSTFAALTGSIKQMPTGLKFSMALVGAEMVGRGIAWVADQISAAHDRAIAKIMETAKVEKQAYDDVKLIRDHGSKELNRIKDEMKRIGRERGEEYGQTAVRIKEALANEIEAIKKRLAEEKLAKEEARKHREEIEKTTTAMGLMTENGLKSLNHETQLVVEVIKKNESAFKNNRAASENMKEAIQKQLDKYEALGKKAPGALQKLADKHGVVSTATEKSIQAMKNYAGTLGFFEKDKVNEEIKQMTAVLGNFADQYRKNPEMIKDLLERVDALKTKARQTNAQITPELTTHEQEMRELQKAYDEAANTVYIFGIALPIDKMKEMSDKAVENQKAVDDYARSLGFLSPEDVSAELDKMTKALEQQAQQYERNPKLLKPLIEKVKVLREQARQSGVDVSESFEKQEKKVKDAARAYEETEKEAINLTDKQKKMVEVVGISEAQFAKLAEVTGEIGGKLSSIAGGGQKVLGFLSEAGIVSDKTSEALGGLLGGVGQVGAGFTELAANPIGGALKIVGGIVKTVTSIFKLFAGDGVGEAIDRERQFISISEEMEEKIRDLEDDIGDTHAAISLLMDEIIKEADINANNLEDYARRVGEIVLDLDRGHINMQQFQESMGKSWNAILEEAQNLGMEGSFEILSIIRNMRNRGMEVAEIQEYVNEQIQAGIDAYNEYLATFGNVGEITEKIRELEEQLAETAIGTQEYTDLTAALQEQYDLLNETIVDIGGNFDSMKLYAIGMIEAMIAEGATYLEVMEAMDTALDTLAQIAIDNGLEVSGALKELLDMKEFMNQNEEVVKRISATIQVMEALGNTSYLSKNLFDQFQKDAQSHFDTLSEKTEDAKQAYQLLAPELGKLLWYSQQYGYELDENIKKLIAEADQHGINMKAMIPPQEKMVALMEELVKVLGGEIPYALDQFRDRGVQDFGDIDNETGKWARGLDDIESKLRNDLPDAIQDLNEEYTNAMSGHSIVTETAKWKKSLGDVEQVLSTDLTEVADNLDAKYENVLREMKDRLLETGAAGSDVRESFEEIAAACGLSGEAIQELVDGPAQQFIDISEDMQERIDELTETLGDTHAATSTLMAEIIRNAEINEDNFGTYVQRTGEILDDYINGTLSLKETQEAMGSAFSELLKNAQLLGTEGSKEMIALLKDVRDQGIIVAEMQEYVNSKLDEGVGALETYLSTFADTGAIQKEIEALSTELAEGNLTAEEAALKQEELRLKQEELALATQDVAANWEFMQAMALSAFSALEAQGYSFVEIVDMMQGQLADLALMAEENGLEVSEGLQAMTDMAHFIEQNQDLANRIEATRTMMEALGDSAFLTANDFSMFSQQTQMQFDDIVAKTGDNELALRLLAPALEDLIKYSESYGYAIDASTQALIDQAREQGLLAGETQSDAEITNDLLRLIAETLGATIPDSLKNLSDEVDTSMDFIEGKTGDWQESLSDVESQIERELPDAIERLDKQYARAMTGHSIVTETQKWKYSLEEVEQILGRELLETADSLDKKYKHVVGNIHEYLKKTSAEGFKIRLSFNEMVAELQRLQDAYDILAVKRRRSQREEGIMEDYKRQIKELSTAIKETAPSLENFKKLFKEFQEGVSGDIGINRGMIEMTRNLRSQGQSLDEIDRLIEKSLTGGARGLAAWVEALGPTGDQMETIKKVQEEYNKLLEKQVLSEEELTRLGELKEELYQRQHESQLSLLQDQQELLNSQDLMVAYFHSLQAEGKNVFEVMSAMADSFEAVTGKALAGDTGLVMTRTFSQLYELQQKMEENEPLIRGIEGLSGALHGMGDSLLYLSEDTFGRFEQSAEKAVEKLKGAGFDQRQSLQLMAPLLRDLEAYSTEYGFSLSRNTRTMLQEAKEAGLIKEKQKSDTEKLIEANERLAAVIEQMVDAFSGMDESNPFSKMEQQVIGLQTKIQGLNNELELLYKQAGNYSSPTVGAFISAAQGFHGVLPRDTWFRLHEGERVDVWSPEETQRIQATPVSRLNLSDNRPSERGGDIIFEHITIQSENGEEAVKEFMNAIKGNKFGVQNLIRRVAH